MRAFLTIVGVSAALSACSTDDFTPVNDASASDGAPDTSSNDATVDVTPDVVADAAVDSTVDVIDAGFTPTSLSGLVLWLDSAKRDGNDIWVDQANPSHPLAANNEVPAPPKKPTFQPTGGPKGLPAMSFDGAQPNMVAFSDSPDFHPRADADVIYAAVLSLVPDDAGAQQRYIAVQFQKFGGVNDGFGLESAGNYPGMRVGSALVFWTPTPPIVADSNFHVITMFRSNGGQNYQLTVDTTVVNATVGAPDLDASVSARGPLTIGDAIVFYNGNMTLGGGPITGKIAELLMFTASAPATLGQQTHVAKVTSYLKAKYGL